jgi:hypothetical protein
VKDPQRRSAGSVFRQHYVSLDSRGYILQQLCAVNRLGPRLGLGQVQRATLLLVGFNPQFLAPL